MANKKQIILVAEDDPMYARVYQMKLQKEGYDVVVVGTGREAVEKSVELSPDLILMDLIMPELDGFAAMKKIKATTKTKGIKIVVLSNLGQETDKQMAINLGAVDYLIKSNISIEDLIKKIDGYLK